MNEMEMLTHLRDEVPLAPPTAGAERLFLAGLADIRGGSPAGGRQGGPSWLPGSRRARMAAAIALAGAVAAGVLVAVLPGDGGGSPAPAISAQLLADRAAKAALAGPSVPAGQWVYRKIESEYYLRSSQPTRETHGEWETADSARFSEGNSYVIQGRGADPEMPSYSQLSSLPADPVALDHYLAQRAYPNQNPTAIDMEVSAFSMIERLLDSYVLPPSLVAELYHALADIPTVTVREHVTDIAGRSGIAFFLPQTVNVYPHPQTGPSSLPSDEESSNGSAGSENEELILSTTDYHVLAEAGWASNGTPANPITMAGSFHERAYLSEAFVSGPGVLP